MNRHELRAASTIHTQTLGKLKRNKGKKEDRTRKVEMKTKRSGRKENEEDEERRFPLPTPTPNTPGYVQINLREEITDAFQTPQGVEISWVDA